MSLNQHATFDPSLDFRTEIPEGADTDLASPTLREWHRQLWSKRLPNGQVLGLDASAPIGKRYLSWSSFVFASDMVMPTFTRWKRMQPIISQFPPEESEAFRAVGFSIGSYMIWPGVARGGQKTINVERGFSAPIADRMDLTMEALRRYYLGEDSPLYVVFSANADFLDLFVDFDGFVEFFLLQDLISPSGEVAFFLPFGGFDSSGMPKDATAYAEYRRRAVEFIHARGTRMSAWIATRSVEHPAGITLPAASAD